jgi:RNA polymerase sigma factor (sigma-70 family)
LTLLQRDPPLLADFRAGKRAALESVYRHYVDELTRLLRLGFIVGDAGALRVKGLEGPELRDAVQEVFVRAFQEKARRSYDEARPYRPYLLRIARNLRLDQLRVGGREQPLSALASSAGDPIDLDALIATDAQEPILAPQVQATREWQALLRKTEAYLSGLEPELRRFVQLRFVEEQGQEQVARAMGVTRRQVRSWEDRVQAGLKRHLAR